MTQSKKILEASINKDFSEILKLSEEYTFDFKEFVMLNSHNRDAYLAINTIIGTDRYLDGYDSLKNSIIINCMDNIDLLDLIPFLSSLKYIVKLERKKSTHVIGRYFNKLSISPLKEVRYIKLNINTLIPYSYLEPYIKEAESLLKARSKKKEFIKSSTNRINRIRDIQDKFNNKILGDIITITENIHEIFIKRDLSTYKLEQFHTYYSENLLGILDDYLNKVESDINPKLGEMKSLEDKLNKINKYIKYIEESLRQILLTEFTIKARPEKASFEAYNHTIYSKEKKGVKFSDSVVFDKKFLEVNNLDISKSIGLSPKFISRKIMSKVINKITINIIYTDINSDFSIIFKNKGCYWKFSRTKVKGTFLYLIEEVTKKEVIPSIHEYENFYAYINNVYNTNISKLREELYEIKDTNITNALDKYHTKITDFLAEKRVISADDRLLQNLNTAMDLKMSKI